MKRKFAPIIKGGGYRKWFGNNNSVIYFDISSFKTLAISGNKLPSREFYFRENINWNRISSSVTSFRYSNSGFLFESASLCAYSESQSNLYFILVAINSCIIPHLLEVINPTTNMLSGYFDQIRIPMHVDEIFCDREQMAKHLIEIAQIDWDSYETSWDFTSLPLLEASYRSDTLAFTYANLRAHWNEMTLEMQRLEEENNRIFIKAYGLEEELTPDVPLKEITLTCNPHYRYGDNKSDSELEELLLADTMKELISYAVGCMFGRYSLDKPGLILANQGETYSDYCRLVPDSSFPADEDNAIPVLDGDWFSDDIVSRFRKFLRVAFGEEKYEENLRFVEAALGKDLRQYFLRDFYNDHVKRYKKRPIYWMFSSPDGSFNVLIYMHRYRPDTASIILSEYLREYQVRLSAYMDNLRRKEANPDLSKGEKVKALKELDKLRKTQDALTAYERDILFPLANQRIEIDLDDGVKVNYPKFGVALKKIAGLEAKDEE